MKRLHITTICMAALTLLTISSPSIAGYFDLNDGNSHVIADDKYGDSDVRLDYFTVHNPGTHLDVRAGGILNSLSMYHNSTADIFEGSLGAIETYGYSSLDIANVSTTYLGAYSNSNVIISNGLFRLGVSGNDDATIFISGGWIKETLNIFKNGNIHLWGTDFKVTNYEGITSSLTDGDKVSDFATFVEGDGYYGGSITGKLTSGFGVDADFYIYNSGIHEGTGNIYIAKPPSNPAPVPVPSALLLGSLGMSLVGWIRRCSL